MRRLCALLVILLAGACEDRAGSEIVSRHDVWREIQPHADRYRIDARLVFSLVAAESNFNARALNGEARGLLQIKPAAWRTVSSQPYGEKVWDWRANLQAGIEYLAWCRQQLHARGRYSDQLMLAAFHYGFDAVERAGFDVRKFRPPAGRIYRELWRGNFAAEPAPIGTER